MIRTKKYLQQRVLLPRNVWKPLPLLSAQTALGVTKERLNYLFNKTLIMQDAYFLLLGLWFSHTRGSFRSFRLAAESFCIRYSLSLQPPEPRALLATAGSVASSEWMRVVPCGSPEYGEKYTILF